ncbi:MAG TPA: DUF3098 domain-containing protein [Puia sp.]|nr:DUF3098 domain-containing protein [Puia sp.]
MATTKKETATPATRTSTPASRASTPASRATPGPKTKTPAPKSYSTAPLFGKENYRWMLIGIALVALGLILMAGGKSPDPNVFNKDEVYSVRRITIAPILILAGFVVEIFAIFRKDKPNTQA